MTHVVMLVHEENGRYGASFPDFPGCTTVADDLNVLLPKAAQALAFHVRALAEDGVEPLAPRSLAELRQDPDFQADAADALVTLAEVDLPGRTVRVNITLDDAVLRRIDAAARALGESRSGFIAASAKERIAALGGFDAQPSAGGGGPAGPAPRATRRRA